MSTIAEVFLQKIGRAKTALTEAVFTLEEMPDSEAKKNMIKELKENIGDLHCVSVKMKS